MSRQTEERGFSRRAEEKLASSGISTADALRAGLYSVEDASEEVHREFAPVPALVFPYFDLDGAPVIFERGGEFLPFVRVRYLSAPPQRGFVKQKPQRYAQLKGSGARAYFPPVLPWRKIADDPGIPIVYTEGELKALCACSRGIPTIGLGGVDSFVCRTDARS
ncbi:MAG: DUF3854 domain-containing protein [Micropepsaceae bacterium]